MAKPIVMSSSATRAAPLSPATPPTAAAPVVCWGPPMALENLTKSYKLGHELGKGSYGVVFAGTRLSDGQPCAVKCVPKSRLAADPTALADARREGEVLSLVSPHPGIASLLDLAEDRHNAYYVTEICSGGELFDALVARGAFGEADAAACFEAMLRALDHCHSLGVMHRDVKPENFLLVSEEEQEAAVARRRREEEEEEEEEEAAEEEAEEEGEENGSSSSSSSSSSSDDDDDDGGGEEERDGAAAAAAAGRDDVAVASSSEPSKSEEKQHDIASRLRLADFGLAAYALPGETLKDVVGSAPYVAPEVLKRSYTSAADLWSLGVVLYIVLTGLPPFWGDTDDAVFDMVLSAELDLETPPWPSISAEAKDLVRSLLERDPEKRPTAAQALRHPWLQSFRGGGGGGGGGSDASSREAKPLDPVVLSRLKSFSKLNKLRRAALLTAAKSLPAKETAALRELFDRFDADGDGTLTVAELREALSRVASPEALASAGGGSALEAAVEAAAASADASCVVDGSSSPSPSPSPSPSSPSSSCEKGLTFAEFVASVSSLQALTRSDTLAAAFAAWDADGSGALSREEFAAALRASGVAAEEAERLFAEADVSGDGSLSFDEWSMAVTGKGGNGSSGNGRGRRRRSKSGREQHRHHHHHHHHHHRSKDDDDASASVDNTIVSSTSSGSLSSSSGGSGGSSSGTETDAAADEALARSATAVARRRMAIASQAAVERAGGGGAST